MQTAPWNDRYVVPAPLTEVVPILEVALTLLEVVLILLEVVPEADLRTILTDAAARPTRIVSNWRQPCRTTSQPSVRAMSALRVAGWGDCEDWDWKYIMECR